MNRRLADATALVLFAGILTCWAQGFWPVALVECGAFLLAGIWIIRWMGTAAAAVSSPGLVPVTCILIWGAFQLATGRSVYSFETATSLVAWAANGAVFFVALQVCAETQTRNRFIRSILWFGFAVSLLAVVQYFTSGGKIFWLFPTPYLRTLGPFLYKNECAAFLELVFPLAVYQALVDGRHAPVYMAIAATMFAAVIATTSRAGTVLLAAELLAILILAGSRGLIPHANLAKTLLRIGALCLVLAAVVGWQVTLEKFREPEPYRVRRELLLSSINMIGDRPWMGFGLGTWPTVYPAYARFDNGLVANHAHNDWAEWAVEGGLPFFALVTMLAAWTVPRAADSVWGIGIAAVFVHSLVDYPLREPAVAALLFAMLGALAGRARTIAATFE